MKKVNLTEVPLEEHRSPKGKYHTRYQEVSKALGADQDSPERACRHPFDLAVVRLQAGARLCPFHSHSAQWEMYLVLTGRGVVRDSAGETEVGPGDAFVFPPGEPHQLRNPGPEEFTYYVIADNPPGEWCHYPDSGKYLVRGKDRTVLQGLQAGYLDGEE